MLSWRSAQAGLDPAVFSLQESRSEDFSRPREIYRGPDASRVMSGKEDGLYHYRVGIQVEGALVWSDPVQVEVRHHSLRRAFSFFLVGLVVFLATAGVVLVGARSDPSGWSK